MKSDDKKRARLACLHHFLYSLPYSRKNEALVKGADPLIAGRAIAVVGRNAPAIVRPRGTAP